MADGTPFQETADKKFQTSLVKALDNSILWLKLKVGAKIIMTANAGTLYSNGQQGIIYKLYNDNILVRFLKDGKYGKPTKINRHKYYVWEYSMYEEDLNPTLHAFTVEQFPVKVAYAISIHKSQGMTLDGVLLHPHVYTPGELYVALSRVKDPANLYLSEKVSRRYIMTSFDVLKLYNLAIGSFPTASQEDYLDY